MRIGKVVREIEIPEREEPLRIPEPDKEPVNPQVAPEREKERERELVPA